MADTTLPLRAFLGADHWERLRCYDGATNLPVIWSEFTKISFNVRVPSVTAGKDGAIVCEVNSLDNPQLFRIFPNSEILELDTSNLPGLTPNSKYECLLKGHDAVRVRGQILGDYVSDTDYPNITLTTSAGR